MVQVSQALTSFVSCLSILPIVAGLNCKCAPNDPCWPSQADWSSFNKTLSGALIRGLPPASVCYPSQPNYNEDQCAIVRSQWFNSTWHEDDPISINYPVWANNSCNPIWPNGTSLTGDTNAGARGCSIGNYPVYVVSAKTAEHVSKALRWASKKNLRVVVKNTGHSYNGRSTGYGSLSIWTHNLRGIEFIDNYKSDSYGDKKKQAAARFGAGLTGVQLQAEMAKHNHVVVTGSNPDVGAIGWLTGGGHGALSSTYGMGADNLLEAVIVTPDGDVKKASPRSNPDLFFAIRGGGGGTYGVVLEATVKAFPSPKTTVHRFSFGSLSPSISTEYWQMVGFVQAEMIRLKKGGMQGYYFIVGPPVYPTLAFTWIFYLYDKPEGTAEKLMAPIEEKLKQKSDLFMTITDVTTTATYWESAAQIANEEVANVQSALGSRLMSPESLSDPNRTAKVFAQIGPSNDASKPNGKYQNGMILGHLVASPNEPSYYPGLISMNPAWRRTLASILVPESFPEGLPKAQIDEFYQYITWNRTEPLRQLSPDTGAYFNEADANEPDWQESFFGPNYQRLLRIKKQYDPRNLLWCNRCVGSEDLVEQADKKLCYRK